MASTMWACSSAVARESAVGAAEWFFLISDNSTSTPGAVTALDHAFAPIPLGTDLYAQYGDEMALPIVGNFDPPTGNSPAPQLSGDYNQDGSVDAADYVFWRKLFGTSVSAYSGPDGDGDTSVDEDDHDVWSSNFGQTAPSGVGSSLSVSFAFSQDATVDSLTQELMPAAYASSTHASLASNQDRLAATKDAVYDRALASVVRWVEKQKRP